MSHEFETGFFVKEPAWHGLGNVIEDAPSIEDGLKVAGLDWDVLEVPLYANVYAAGPEADAENPPEIWQLDPVPGRKAIVRSTDRRVLGAVGMEYRPLQNRDAFRWFDFLLHENDAELEAAGSLKGGRRVWVLARLKQEAEVAKGDPVQSYILLSNAHDGTMGVWINFTPIRVVCWNTLTAALSNRFDDERVNKAIRFRHVGTINEQMEQAKKLVDLASQTFTSSLEYYRAFAKRKMTDTLFEHYIGQVFDAEDPTKLKSWLPLRERFEAGLGQGDNGAVRGTLWAAYNSVTDWVANIRGRDEHRLDSVWFGSGAAIRDRAFDEALELVR